MKRKIGFIGLGKMGMGMAKNIVKSSYPLIAFDIREEPLKELGKLNMEIAKNSKEVGEKAEVIILMLFDGSQLERVTLGCDGLLESMKKGGTIISMGTIDLRTIKKVAKLASEKTIHMLDAPVSGGSSGAEAGTLTIMASGEKSAVDNCEDIFNAMGKTIFYVGSIGMGQVVKAAHQMLCCSTLATMCEAMVMAVKAGADPEVVYNVISSGLVGSGFFKYYGSNLIQRRFENTEAPIKLLVKDIEIAMEIAKDYKAPMLVSSLVSELFKTSTTLVGEEDDGSSMVTIWEKISGVEVKTARPK